MDSSWGKPVIISWSSQLGDGAEYCKCSPLLIDRNWNDLMKQLENIMKATYNKDFTGKIKINSICEISNELWDILMKDLS